MPASRTRHDWMTEVEVGPEDGMPTTSYFIAENTLSAEKIAGHLGKGGEETILLALEQAVVGRFADPGASQDLRQCDFRISDLIDEIGDRSPRPGPLVGFDEVRIVTGTRFQPARIWRHQEPTGVAVVDDRDGPGRGGSPQTRADSVDRASVVTEHAIRVGWDGPTSVSPCKLSFPSQPLARLAVPAQGRGDRRTDEGEARAHQ